MQEAEQPPGKMDNPYRSPTASPEASLSRFSILDLLILTAIISLTFGAWAFAPGLGVLVTVLAIPVAVRSLLVFKRRAALGIATSPSKKAALIVASLFVAAMIYLGALVAVFAAFWVGCYTAIATNPDGGALAWVLLIGSPIVALIVSVVLAGKWIRHRWRRDTTAEQ